MILHTLHAAPRHPAFEDLLKVAASRDGVVLLGDGVYAALDASEPCRRLCDCGVNLYALQDDAEAAGVTQRINAVRIIDMDTFVQLSEQYRRQQAWY